MTFYVLPVMSRDRAVFQNWAAALNEQTDSGKAQEREREFAIMGTKEESMLEEQKPQVRLEGEQAQREMQDCREFQEESLIIESRKDVGTTSRGWLKSVRLEESARVVFMFAQVLALVTILMLTVRLLLAYRIRARVPLVV